MTTHWHMEPAWRELLRRHGLEQAAAWEQGEPGELISKGRDGEVRRVQLGDEVMYLKRRAGEPVVRLLGSLLFGKRPRSGPLRELYVVQALAAAGIPVMQPVAWGEVRQAGIPRRGWLVVRAVPGRAVAELFAGAVEGERPALMARLGRLLGQLHAHGFFQPLRLKDIIETPQGVLTLIDRESGRPWPQRFSVRAALGSLARSARRTLRDGHVIRPAAACAFLTAYHEAVGDCWPVTRRVLARQVVRRLRREFRQ